MKKHLIEKVLGCPLDGEPLELFADVDKEGDIVSGHLVCRACRHWYRIESGIPSLLPPVLPESLDEQFFFEMSRYDSIVDTGINKYEGMDESRPDVRMRRVADMLAAWGDSLFLNIGVGFGQLERMVPDMEKIGLDISRKVLEVNADVTDGVRGICEQMPFRSGSLPAVISQATFQSIVDQKLFLREIARVLKPGGHMLITIAYRWNYPRKPQTFHVKDSGKLIDYLKSELHVEAETRILKLSSNEFVEDLDEGDLLIVTGKRI